ncbi:SHOCT domain-containing protein [Rhodococcus spongiicola]|uniref:SHOCT domain-containing protein n=1 Tax=Rhodococcus spongiicola TaxID=2487352 RepID=A0A3S3E5Q0_9NOCA|nr:SHOCT domain-containing protein [Rhodococcus spongiicola]RVW06359.1 SHOCT domain-containing protein [Rhodococcus spongiicola]
MMWNDGFGYGWSWGGWVLMVLAMVAFWTLVIVAVMALFRSIRSDRNPPYGTNDTDRRSAETILDERFARGEIDVDEYRIRRDHLRAAQER